MTEAEWLRSDDWWEMLTFLGDRATPRKATLAVCAGLRSIRDKWLYADRSRRAVEVAERMADGNATQDEVIRAGFAAEVSTWGHDFHTAEQLRHQGLKCHGQDIRRLIEWGVFSEADRYADELECEENLGEPEVVGQLLNAANIAEHVLYGVSVAVIERIRSQTDWPGGWLIRDIYGNPFRPVVVEPGWLTEAAVGIARGIYEDRAFERLPILADALQDAGCGHPDILAHCREPGCHVCGCWAVDLVSGKS